MRSLHAIGSALLLLVSSACAVACGAHDGDATSADEAEWGHMAGGDLNTQSPQFLINKKPGEAYRVCLPNYMSTEFPGIESEVYAAINVWASYLGRTIPVEFKRLNLPRATADQDADAVSKSYNDTCGDVDVVMGMAKLDGTTVGLTGVSYMFFPQPDGSRKITSFKRYLFLRDYDLAPDDQSERTRWISLQASGGPSGGVVQGGEDLLATMTARSITEFVQNDQYLALPVLTHEFGHVWGMCDQYEGPNNCDPDHSTSHIVLDSIMSSRSGKERIYLANDDIEGIRALEARPTFAQAQARNWGTPAELTATPTPIAQKPVELVRIESVGHDAEGLHVAFGVVTHLATKYEFFIQRDGDRAWTPLRSHEQSDAGFDAPVSRLTINLGSNDPQPYTVRLQLSSRNADGTWALQNTEEKHEGR